MISERLLRSDSWETAFWMSGIYDPDYPLDELGPLSIEVSAKLRALGCYRLLKDGKFNSFFHNLIRSGMVRLQYLERCLTARALNDHFRGSGRYLPLCDAIAAGDQVLAEKIVSASPVQYMRGHEYEDDFCYAQILHGLATGREEPANALLARFQQYLEGDLNGRYLVAEALTTRSQQKFDKGFEQLLLDREQEIAADVERGQIESPQVLVARRVFVEGLALLKFAGKVGFQTERDYLYCPSIARVRMTEPFQGE